MTTFFRTQPARPPRTRRAAVVTAPFVPRATGLAIFILRLYESYHTSVWQQSDAAVDPAPERVKKTTWTEFLKTHWDVLAATDFFTVDVWTRRGLARLAVLFIIELSRHRVEIAGLPLE